MRAFFDEVVEMLTQIAPSGVDPALTEAAVDKSELMSKIPHVSEPELVIEISVSQGEIIVGALADHHHFDAAGNMTDYDGAWPASASPRWYSYATGYIADILRGRLEIETTFKGRTPFHSKVTHFDEQGEQLGVCHEGIPLVWRLAFFKRTRRETRRPSFMSLCASASLDTRPSIWGSSVQRKACGSVLWWLMLVCDGFRTKETCSGRTR